MDSSGSSASQSFLGHTTSQTGELEATLAVLLVFVWRCGLLMVVVMLVWAVVLW